MPDSISNVRLEVVVLVHKMASDSITGLVKTIDVSNELSKLYGTKYGAAKKSLSYLAKGGWLERPFRGCYRVSSKGYQALEDASVVL